jgi:hypothetical protein
MKKLLFIILLSLVSLYCHAASERIALVIGNSKYDELGILKNTSNDARSIERALREMGFKTKLVLDVNQSSLRRDIRNFANESENASLAVIFYAGHGAQVNGENYLLPTDIEIPKRDSDIQLSAVKVDDIINSLKSKTKVVFLDACRDNPSLIRSLAKGRGGYRGGLAPAKSSSFDDQSSGIFIAYATDAGNVALDGEGQSNSPFTQALLKYIKQPVSIDDMFSMVTKDVRATTKNAQKPYKYASLDGVVCLSGGCSSEFSPIRPEPNSQRDTQLSTQEFSKKQNWVLYNRMAPPTESLVFINPESIERKSNRTSVRTKLIGLSGMEGDPEYGFHVLTQVLDCKSLQGATYIFQQYDKKGNMYKDSQLGNPLTMNLSDYSNKSSVGYATMELACNSGRLVSLVSPKDLNSSGWERQYNDLDNGWDFYVYKPSMIKKGDIATSIGKYVYKTSTPVGQLKFFGPNILYPLYEKDKNAPLVKTIVVKNQFDCKKRRFKILYDNFLDDDGDLVFLSNYFADLNETFDGMELLPNTPFEGYYNLVCTKY